jgi:6-phosphogluconolactonase
MEIIIRENIEELIRLNADLFIETANQEIVAKGIFTVALSGGNSPKRMFELLAADYKSATDWNKIYFFFGDERYVPADNPDSNYLMAKNAFLDTLEIPEENIFAVDTDVDPASAALEYSKCICLFFDGEPIFDLILLGLGDDAHTASLFPNTTILWADEELVKEVYLEDKKVYRISMTATLINQAKKIAFLTFGEAKAIAVKEVIQGVRDIKNHPAQLIDPCNGVVYWFLDKAAAGFLGDN